MAIANVYVVIQSKSLPNVLQPINSNSNQISSAYISNKIRCNKMENDVHTMNKELQYMDKLMRKIPVPVHVIKPVSYAAGKAYAAGKGIQAARLIKANVVATSKRIHYR